MSDGSAEAVEDNITFSIAVVPFLHSLLVAMPPVISNLACHESTKSSLLRKEIGD